MDTRLAGTVRPVWKESQADVPVARCRGQVLNSTPGLRQFFDNKPAAPPAPPFVPAFRAATGTGVGNDGNPVSWSLSKIYFASRETTAHWIANKYGTGQVIEIPFGGARGPFSASATEYYIKVR